LKGNASGSLNLLCLGLKINVKCYDEYFINDYVFHTEEYDQDRRTYNNEVCAKRSTSNEFEVDYYGKLEKVIEL
jgi:hypothetical protein